MLVYEQACMEFRIEGYKDKVLCDIISMDVFHILLGRPCQYHRSAKNDGRKNNYVIEKDEVSYTLTPLKDEDKTPQTGTSVMLVREKEFLKTMK